MINNLKIIYKNVKNINIKIKPTLEVILTAPFNTPKEYINKILEKKQSWILKHISQFKIRNQKLQNNYNDTNYFTYLGNQYNFKILISNNERAELIDDYFYIYVQQIDNNSKKLQLINDWYMKQAKHHFNQIIAKYINIIGKPVTHISVKKMTTRWGSCNPKKGYINLNLELIKKPIDAIEYVVLHELTHLIHYHHNKDFYNYIAAIMPDWKIRQSKLGNI